MTRQEIVSRPPRPRGWTMALAGAIGLALGLGLVRLTMHAAPEGLRAASRGGAAAEWEGGVEEPGPEEDGAGIGAVAAGDDAAPGDERAREADATGEAEAVDEPAEDAEPAGEGAEVEESGAATEEPAAAEDAPERATTPAPYRFERGRVAYIRCPGLEGAGGRCPRDRDLEESVWAALAGVAECAARPAAGGTADVRLTFSGGGAPELRFRDWGDRPLPSASLRACLASAIATLRTSLRADPLVISFRFRFRE